MKIVIEDKLIISMRELQKHKVAFQTLKQLLTYKNPKFIENEKYGYSNYNTNKYLYSFQIVRDKFLISRGALNNVLKHFNKHGIKPQIIDNTLVLPSIEFKHSKTVLREEQREFVNTAIEKTNGILLAYTSFGKSVTCLELIAELQQPAMIVVHTTFLQQQWIKEITNPLLFNMDKKEIGGVGGIFSGKKRRLGKINICLYQSLSKKEHINFFKDKIGILIHDECLHPDTIISTPNGINTLGNIEIGDYVISPDGFPVEVTDKWVVEKDAFEYTFKGGGKLIASKDHKVKGFKFRWEKVREYKHGEYVVAPINQQTNISLPDNYFNIGDISLIDELVGWYIADGGKEDGMKCYRMSFRKKDKIVAFTELLNNLEIKYSKTINSRGDTNISFYSEYLDRLNVACNTINKHIPDELYNKCSISVLRGLFDGDGSFTNTYAEYDTTSEKLHKQICEMLSTIGIYPHRYDIDKKNIKHNTQYRICIMGNELKKFSEIIGFRVKSKKEKMEKYLPSNKLHKPTRDIIDIKPVGKVKLIDITVNSSDHLFIANGFVVSNCQKSPIDDIQMSINSFSARYRFGVTAGVKRKDGKEFLAYDTFGPVVYKAIEKASDSKILANIKIIPSNYSDFEYDMDDSKDYNMMLARMAVNKERNIFICKRVLRQIKNNKLCIIFVERKAQALILAQYLSKFRVDMLLGSTNWKDFSVKHRIDKARATKTVIPESAKILLKAITPKMLDIVKNYDANGSYDRISKLASKKMLDVIIGTQKAEVGLSIRTIDYGIVTTPMGNNLERFNQTLGRVERNYKDSDVEYFKCEKETPVLEVLRDNIGVSISSVENIKRQYGNRVKTVKIK